MYNKNNIAIGKVASKSRVRPELGCVAFYGDRTVATDSFRLIEMSAGGEKKETPVLYWTNDLKNVKLKKNEFTNEDIMGIEPLQTEHSYPVIDGLFDRLKDRPYVEMKVNAQYLAEICDVLKNLDPFQQVVIKMPTESKSDPMVIEATSVRATGDAPTQKARALLMPMNH